ncbi:mercuric reductase [Pleomorphovibrio marinus]|uniref:mercuric reductase n=1 Tax=Pleomorphovibrio marinus TaxID=2164132 RepID=UPI000E0B5DBD|nr:mercuric reductase [Pleomorphovibrio marinus]
MERFDAVIIGAGQAGMPLAHKISSKGHTVALVEQRVIGGTCINDGCSPTKTMAFCAKVAHTVSRAGDYGIEVDAFRINQKKIKQRKNHIVHLFRGGAQKGLDKAENITVIMGKGSIVGQGHVAVQQADGIKRSLSTDAIFINTGSKTKLPNLRGLDQVPFLTSSTIMDLEETPKSLLILGGGYIGLEFAQMFRRFGSEVSVLDSAERLVSKEDTDVCKEVSAIFKKEGISTYFNFEAEEVLNEEGQISIKGRQDGRGVTLKGSHLLVATGRKPNIEGLNAEEAGIVLTDQGFIEVDEQFRTSLKNVYAMGDVSGSPPFTHIAYNDANLVFQAVYENRVLSHKNRLVPYCIFIDPQLARIGLNEQQAKNRGIPYKLGKFWMKHAGRTLEADEKEGFFKVLVDPKDGKILGATILSMDGGEVMAILQMAMIGGVTYEQIKDLPIAHPTLAESLNNLMKQVQG